jgi:CubicO group peptidase (beta-lactamase class C family)
MPLYAPPGTQWDYSNENYYLLAQVVQNVGHASFASWLKEHIFVPAGMTHTYSDEGAPDPALALGYVHRTPQDPFLQCPAPAWSGELGAGGVISTPSDLVRFDIALFNGTLFDAAHRKEMLAPAFSLPGGASMALGWFLLPNGVAFHEGDFTIAAAINAVFPDGTYVAEASNGADLGPDFDRGYFKRQVQNLYGTAPIALGKRNSPSLLSMIGPFSTCAQLDAMLSGS